MILVVKGMLGVHWGSVGGYWGLLGIHGCSGDCLHFCIFVKIIFFFQAGWFGGDTISIRGECTCEQGLFWNDDDLSCDRSQSFGMSL